MANRIGLLERYVDEGDRIHRMYNTRAMKAHYYLARHYLNQGKLDESVMNIYQQGRITAES